MKLKTIFGAALALLALTQVACAEASNTSKAKEGQDYTVYSGAKGTDKPEVLEFFAYTCGHCYNMEGFLEKWKPGKPEEVTFKQIPLFSPSADYYAHAFYVAELLNVMDRVHPAIYHRLHVQKQNIPNKKALIPIFEAAGVSAEEFEKAYNSFAVQNKVQYAKKLSRDFRITATPTFVVNQKYKITNYKNLDYMLSQFPIEKAQ